jgi:hypothetical protein
VGRWITRTVCEVVATVADLIVSVVGGLIKILVGIVTLDPKKILDGIIEAVTGTIKYLVDIFRIGMLGDTIDFIREEINKKRLRDHVRERLDSKFADNPRLRDRIKEALGVDSGVFGWRITGRAVRTFIRSDFRANPDETPQPVLWHENPAFNISLKQMAGFEQPNFWYRSRPEPVLAGTFIAGGGGGGPPQISEKDLDTYISSRGASGPQFRIYCVDKSTFDTKLDTASLKLREIGVLLNWNKETLEVQKPGHVRFDTGGANGEDNSSQNGFFVSQLSRKQNPPDMLGARKDLSVPLAVGVFFYSNSKLNGLSTHMDNATCLDGSNFPGDGLSGVTLRDRIPDIVWKYVLPHELGHYFGLCHADGLERIMYQTAMSPWSWEMLIEYFYTSGEPIFIFDEARRAWNYIIDAADPETLATRAH